MLSTQQMMYRITLIIAQVNSTQYILIIKIPWAYF